MVSILAYVYFLIRPSVFYFTQILFLSLILVSRFLPNSQSYIAKILFSTSHSHTLKYLHSIVQLFLMVMRILF